MQLAGSDFDCGAVSFPGVVDWNNDGKKDVFCGEDKGKVLLLINEGTDADPVFNTASFIKDGSGDLKVSMRSNPVVADWNRDGKKDLIVGEEFGYIFFYENKNIDADPLFSGGIQMEAGGQKIDTDSRARLDVADWDEDGVLDLLSGQDKWTPSHGPARVIYFHALGPLSLSDNEIPESTGARIDLNLDAGAANGGRNYMILGSVSGTAPGIPLPGGQVTLPLNWDLFTSVMIGLVNTPLFKDFTGTLDGNGEAAAQFNTMIVAPLPSMMGLAMSFAYALNGPWNYVSNGVNIEFVP